MFNYGDRVTCDNDGDQVEGTFAGLTSSEGDTKIVIYMTFGGIYIADPENVKPHPLSVN